MKRVFLDANVIFTAAHNFRGNGRALFTLATEGRLQLVSSRYAIEEAWRNIALKYPECLRELSDLLATLGVTGEPGVEHSSLASGHGLPDKDIPILAAAIAASATVLVTGDRRDFGSLYGKKVAGVTVVTPAQAVTLGLS